MVRSSIQTEKEAIVDQNVMLSKAIALSATRHMHQFDKGGNPYILHVLKVMHYTKSTDLEVLQIAVLHDVVEDTGITYQELREMGFSERVIAGIKALTKVPGQSHDEYKAGILANKDALIVKLADLRHNSDIRRLKGVTQKDLKRIEKYHNMWVEFKEALDNWHDPLAGSHKLHVPADYYSQPPSNGPDLTGTLRWGEDGFK